MDRITRRALLAGTTAAAVLGCGGHAGNAQTPPPAAPEPPRPAGDPGEPGTLFRVDAGADVAGTHWNQTPAWFRDAPGLWCPNTRSAGSVLLTFSPRGPIDDLCKQIQHFRQLPELLAEGRAHGSDVLYLVDWFQGPPDAPCGDWWRHKGRYLPREDLGGTSAFVEAVRAVQALGGRVVLYVEPFIIEKATDLGAEKGQAWSIKTAEGYPEDPYPTAWKLCPANPEMVAHFVEVAGRLVGEYGADGLFLDSYGNQRGWACVEAAHGHAPGEGAVFDQGVRDLVRAMRDAARAKNPEAVLFCEGAKLPMLGTWLDGSLDWGIHTVSKGWVWREAGHTAVFSAGWSLDDLHQLVALGHRLALGSHFWSKPLEGRCSDAIAARLPTRPVDPKTDRLRRFFAEECFRDLHRFRNAGLLLGRPMPNLDEATPRRWDQNPRFQTEGGLDAILAKCKDLAERIDLGLAGQASLPTARDHVKALMAARSKFSRVLPGATVRVLDAPSPESAAYLFEGPAGRGFTCVNVSGKPLKTGLAVGEGTFEDLVGGGTVQAKGGLRVEVPPHAVRLWASA